jgi:hypothetical protein
VNDFKKKLALWNWAGFPLLAAVGLFWWAGADLLDGTARDQNELDARFSPPSPECPKPSHIAVLYNREAGRFVDLDGLAVAYPDPIESLVRDDGSFRTDLSLAEMAKIVKVPAAKLAKGGSTTRIDPEAVLFRVALGRLTEDSKARSRERRAIDTARRQAISLDVYEWITSERSFTLRALTNPCPDDKAILDAISRAVRGVPAPAGDKIKAVGSWAVANLHEAPFIFTGGFLPREEPPVDAVEATLDAAERER